jgi:hypothetical protein
VAQPISRTTLPQNCLFDEFGPIYGMAYDLQLKGCTTFRPNPANWNALVEDIAASRRLTADVGGSLIRRSR